MTAAIVLAGGASTRLGEPKQLVTLAGETLLERAVRTAEEACCAPVVVVLGASHVEILGNACLRSAVHVVNSAWQEGMASSIRLGIQTLMSGDPTARAEEAVPAAGVIVMTCDQPAVTAAHLLALMSSGQIRASAYAGRRGVPAYFPRSAFAALLELRGDIGAREILRSADAIDLPGGELDIDTALDVDLAESLFGKSKML